jgi:hypothetical protein
MNKIVSSGLPVAIFAAGVLLTTSAAPCQAAMYALYQFEDASGTVGATINDGSTFNNDGIVTHGNITLGPGRPGGGNAATTTSGSVIRSGLGVASTQADYTIAFWMRSNGFNTSQRYITARDVSGNQLSVIYEYVDNQLELFGASVDVRTGSAVPIADTNWHHYVYTRTGSALTKYVDGVATAYGTNGTAIPSPDALVVGGIFANNGSNFDGQVDDVAWMNEGVNQAQVNAIRAGDFSQWGGPVPEPSAAMLSLAGIGVLLRRRR